MPAESSDAPTRALVLVVDDFEDCRLMYAECLASTGYRVETAENGAVAVEKAKHLLPAVIVMDLSMPVMDGWEATRVLKQDADTKHIRIIAVTGHSEVHHAERARTAGCDAFLPKPCSPRELAAKVAEWLPARSRA